MTSLLDELSKPGPGEIKLPHHVGYEILRCEVGSTLHGTGLGVAREDHDEMGVFIEKPDTTIGLNQRDHWDTRTAERGAKSQPGDTDLVCYCHAPESLVLTEQLEWVRIDSLEVGQGLVTFDEADNTPERHRHFSTGTITALQTRVMERMTIVTSEGSTTVTPEHGFLVRRDATKPRTRWVDAKDLKPGDQIYFLKPWEQDNSWGSGYLAGQFDGDGCLTFTQTNDDGGGVSSLSWAQLADSPSVEYVANVMHGFGFATRSHQSGSACQALHVAGAWSEQMRFLGVIRPDRLLRHPELRRLWEQRSLQVCNRAVVEGVNVLSAGPMVAMETSTHTYIADGCLTHNSLRKWARLAINGNPSVILLLHAPDHKLVHITPLGAELRQNAKWFSSKRAGAAFLGYMEQQRQRLVGQRGRAGRVRVLGDCKACNGEGKVDIVPGEDYPDGRFTCSECKGTGKQVDWKYAMHLLRLGYQGVEFLTTGKLTLPVPGETGDWLREVRQGHEDFAKVIDVAESLEAQVKRLLDDTTRALCPLPDEPNRDRIHHWVMSAHLQQWGFGRGA